MSLVVDALKIAQKIGVAKGPLPPFIKYPYEEGLRIRAFISKHTRLFRATIGFTVLMILAVFVITSLNSKSNSDSEADVSHKSTAVITLPSRESAAAPAETELSEENFSPVQEAKIQAVGHDQKSAPPSLKLNNTPSKDNSGPNRRVLVEIKTSNGVVHHFERAVSYQKRGDKAMAMKEYGKVIAIDPLNVESHNNLGVIYKDMGKLNQAIKEFQTVLSVNPRQEKAHNNLGIIYYLQGNPEKAIQEFRNVLDINARNIEAYINMGVIYKKQKQTGKARRALENALSMDPHCPEAHYNLALVCEENGHIKEAITHYQTFIQVADTTHPELAARVKRHLETLSD